MKFRTLNQVKYVCIVISIFMTVIMFISCQNGSGSSQSEDNNADNTTSDLLNDELEIKVLAISNMDGSNVTAGTVMNHSDMIYSVHAEIFYYDEHSTVIGTHPTAIFDIYPGVEHAVFVLAAEDWSNAAYAEVKVTNIIKEEQTDISPDFEFSNISVEYHEYGARIHGSIINKDEMRYSVIILGSIVGEDDEIKRANIEGIDNIYPGDTRPFTINTLGEECDDTDAVVYIESITKVSSEEDYEAILFENQRMTYNEGSGRTIVFCDVVNHDDWGYDNVWLLFRVYNAGQLIDTEETALGRIGAGERISFERSLFDGNYEDYTLNIQVTLLDSDND